MEQYNIVHEPTSPWLEKEIRKVLKEKAEAALGKPSSTKKEYALYVKAEDLFVGGLVYEYLWGAMYLKMVAVAPAYQRQGIGTKLICTAIQAARQKKATLIHLETMNFQAIGFYKKLGFQTEFIRTYTPKIAMHYLIQKLQ